MLEQTQKGVNWSDSQCSFKLEGSSHQKSETPVGITSVKTELYFIYIFLYILEGVCQYFYNTELPEEAREGLLRPRGPTCFCVSMAIGQTVGQSWLASAQLPTPLLVGASQSPMEQTQDLTTLIYSSNLLKNSSELFRVV